MSEEEKQECCDDWVNDDELDMLLEFDPSNQPARRPLESFEVKMARAKAAAEYVNRTGNYPR